MKRSYFVKWDSSRGSKIMRRDMYDEDASSDVDIVFYGAIRCFFGVVEVW
jgi:hypothetical protein